MSFVDKLKHRIDHIKEITIKEIIADDDIAEQRLSICEKCPHLIKLTNQCSKCGCFINAKTKLKNASCPENKW